MRQMRKLLYLFAYKKQPVAGVEAPKSKPEATDRNSTVVYDSSVNGLGCPVASASSRIQLLQHQISVRIGISKLKEEWETHAKEVALLKNKLTEEKNKTEEQERILQQQQTILQQHQTKKLSFEVERESYCRNTNILCVSSAHLPSATPHYSIGVREESATAHVFRRLMRRKKVYLKLRLNKDSYCVGWS